MSDRNRYQQYRFRSSGIGGSSLTPMVKRLLIANVAVYLFQLFFGGYTFVAYFAVSVDAFFSGFFWQPFTYMWLHAPSSAFHLLFNMFALWMFGGPLESVWGSRRFLRFYLTCGVGAGVIIVLWNSLMGVPYPTLGASGAIYGLLMAFGLTWPDRTIVLLFPPIPIKAIWFIPFLFLMSLLFGGGNISHVGHLGGVIVAGWLMRGELSRYLSFGSLRHRWHRWRMRNRLRAVRREEWERRNEDDDEPRPH
ncbi:MAG: rhomboid family intramembrane serine protease [Proteobacteria bacterium]|nr:rhomboid family intramembrane serine protease [Pseudomonadota bacterium]